MGIENFHHHIFGETSLPKAVFLHGILGQGKNWRSYARRFSGDLQSLIYDQRGHGESYHPTEGYDLTNFSQDLLDNLTDLGWGSPIQLLGHSMGGRVALQFANDYPERVARLVIVDIGPTSDWASMQRIVDRIESVPVPFASQQEAKVFFKGDFQNIHGVAMANFFSTNIREIQPGVWDWVFYKPGIVQFLENSRLTDYWDLFRNLACPTLLIRGETSTDLRQDDYDRILANNPHIQGVVIPNAGHWVHVDQPSVTRQVLEDFFMIAAKDG